MPFFTCKNHLLDKNIQKDIARYIYCKDLGISPYKGSYGEQPANWVDSFFVIKNAFAKKEQTSTALLIDKKKLKGAVSIRQLSKKGITDPSKFKLKNLTKGKVHALNPNDDVEVAAKILLE